MKRIIALLAFGIYFQSFSLSIPGSVIGENTSINPNEIIRYRLPFVSDQLSYVNGGVTFTYPFTFLNNPRVTVSVELPFGTPFDPTILYTAIIESNTTTSAIIRVNKAAYDGVTLTTIAEAATNEVVVTIFALENPF